ncbi:hypothetical protein NX059_011323 [Plenodomus lindquistii]|nr:hypothetical protein NX059_011323 [Plenodomus lindquistii]
MAMMLAPYNDSMRPGMGFNSYTQSLCIDGAVEIRDSSMRKTDNPSQVVSYSSKLVQHLSEVVSSMQVSHSSSIKKGTVEVAGNGDSINEDKIKSSDINAVISVKVVNQTIISGDDAKYCPLPGINPGTSEFNDKFGDCYISGYITGGEFNGIVSMRVVDRSKTASVVSAIRKSSRSGTGTEFTLDRDSSSSAFLDSSILKDTETTITVSWMGGGQIKDPHKPWTLESVYAAADAFPARVAKRPQYTWAILTKYKANRSFVEETQKLSFSPLEYDLVAAFTSNLFDNYMDYKSLVKLVQDIMAKPDKYVRKNVASSIPIDVGTLVAVRSALRTEMNKIVQAVDILTKDPQILKRSRPLGLTSPSKEVEEIIANSLKGIGPDEIQAFWDWDEFEESGDCHRPKAGDPTSAKKELPAEAISDLPKTIDIVADPNDQELSAGATATTAVDKPTRTKEHDNDSGAPHQATAMTDLRTASASRRTERKRQPATLNFDLLISPEIWRNVMPAPVDTSAQIPNVELSTMPLSMTNKFPEAPKDDIKDLGSRVVGAPVPQLEILCAACGVVDCTDTLRELIKPDNTLEIKTADIRGSLVSNSDQPADIGQIFLAFVYRYTGQSARLVVTCDIDTNQTYTVTPASTEHSIVTPTDWTPATWCIAAVVFGGKHFSDAGDYSRVLAEITKNHDNGRGSRSVDITVDLIEDDPLPDEPKSSMLFYQLRKVGEDASELNDVSEEWDGCKMQLANAAEFKLVNFADGGGVPRLCTKHVPFTDLNRCVTLNLVDQTRRDSGWWLLTEHGNALQMLPDFSTVSRRFDSSELGQQWHLTRSSSDPMRILITSLAWVRSPMRLPSEMFGGDLVEGEKWGMEYGPVQFEYYPLLLSMEET